MDALRFYYKVLSTIIVTKEPTVLRKNIQA